MSSKKYPMTVKLGLVTNNLKSYLTHRQFKTKSCSFKNCTGIMDEVFCGCMTCRKCERTDGTDCTYE